MCANTYANPNMQEICTHTHMQLELCNNIQLHARMYRMGIAYERNMHKYAYMQVRFTQYVHNKPECAKLTICTYMEESHMHKYAQICIFKICTNMHFRKICINAHYMHIYGLYA